MPLKGTVCCKNGMTSDFGPCLSSSRDGSCAHGHPLIVTMAGNVASREGSGNSATTILQCPRKVIISESEDVFESPDDYYARYRGEAFHALEERSGPFPGVSQEIRMSREIDVLGETFRVTGKPDWYDKDNGILRDTKSTARIPEQPYDSHIAQINIYAWILAQWYQVKRAQIDYCDMRHHELVDVELWPLEQTEDFIRSKMEPLVRSKKTGELPPVLEGFPSHWECRYCPVKETCIRNYQKGL